MKKNLLEETSKIVVWGASESGKNWFIHAFGKTMSEYSLADDDFHYEITDKDGRILDCQPTNVESAEEVGDKVFRFRRRGKKLSQKHRISSHTHEIRIIENKSAGLVSLNSSGLISSPYTILLLDASRQQRAQSPKNGGLTNQQELFDDSDTSATSPEKEFQSIAKYLLQLLNGSIIRERRIAVCLTKIDMLHLRRRDPAELIKMLFGEYVYFLFTEYRSIPNTAIEFFCVSSAGFIMDSSGIKPNFDFASRNLLEESSWAPYNVASPFFWLFEDIEKKRIARSGGLIESKLFGSSRLKKYIPYPFPRA